MSTSRERREQKIIDDEILVINPHIDWYEKQYIKISNNKYVPEDVKLNVLGWLAAATLAVKKNKIRIALSSILEVHDIYFEYIADMKATPWNDDFAALLVKYKMKRD